ncbi:type II toxin-antitoxin system RelE/ParE family toxin [Pseudoxanthomonas sp. UC19_8]|uniref:type II toxin-antitoxin system RelE/ParE family toxin n=1 Tax=Pseudoxanthomonas sp. UC19_8 TaxID=3350175 RepID=UPI0036D2A9E9
MSDASNPARARTRPWNDRVDPWVGALLSLLLHLLMLWVLLHADVPVVQTTQGAPAGGRTRVDFIGESTAPADPAPPSPRPSRQPTPPTPVPPKPKIARKPPPASRLQTTRVDHAADPLLTEADTTPAPSATPSPPVPAPAQTPPQASTRPPANPPPTDRRSPNWGHPPGYIAQDSAPENAGFDDSPALNQGRGRDSGMDGASLSVGGYQAYYEPRVEERVRTWMAQGMKEFFIPLPGTEYLMVCPLEIVLRNGSGPCRALPPDSPELKGIGDSRDIINMQRVYHRGELVWKGPGPYR